MDTHAARTVSFRPGQHPRPLFQRTPGPHMRSTPRNTHKQALYEEFAFATFFDPSRFHTKFTPRCLVDVTTSTRRFRPLCAAPIRVFIFFRCPSGLIMKHISKPFVIEFFRSSQMEAERPRCRNRSDDAMIGAPGPAPAAQIESSSGPQSKAKFSSPNFGQLCFARKCRAQTLDKTLKTP